MIKETNSKKRYRINNIFADEFNIISHAVVRKPIKYMCRGDPNSL